MTSEEESPTSTGSGAGKNKRSFSRRALLGGAIAVGAGGYLMIRRDRGPIDERHSWSPAAAPLETPWFEDVSPDDPHPEYPRPQMVRDRWRHLNGVWGFEPAADGDDPPFDRRLEEGVLVPFPVESALSGLGREEDHFWYRRTFEVPREWNVREDEELLVHFEAVDYRTTVYVNGQEVGDHVGGYDHFAFEVSDALTEARRQELVVEVVDRTEEGQTLGKQHPNDGGIWYTSSSGVWQTVWMEPVPESRIEGFDLAPDLEDEVLRLSVETTDTTRTRVEAVAFEDGEEVGSVAGAPDEALELPITDPRPWSPSDPFLYDLEIRLIRDGDAVDVVESYFGMRTVGTERIGPDVRMTLNGDFVFNLATLDQGFWPDGIYTAPTDEALAFDLHEHLELGFNAVRKHVKVEPRRWYYHADRLGLLVHQDMPSTADFSGAPDEAGREQFERELHAMVDQLGNHPSVVAWIPFNEGWGAYDQERIAAAVSEWDSERLVTANSGSNIDGGDCGCGDVVDYHNYPGPGPTPPVDDRAVVLGEFGGLGLAVEDHRWQDAEEFSYDTYLTVGGLTEAYIEQIERVGVLVQGCGLSGAVYTQLTDVENETNGLLTYDRTVEKPVVDLVREANRAVLEDSRELDPPSAASSGDVDAVGHWPLDGDDGEAVTDVVGGNDAAFVGDPTRVDGPSGPSLSFDDDFAVTDGPVIDALDSYTVAARVNLADANAIRTAISQSGEYASAFSLGYVGAEDRFAFTAAERDAGGEAVRAFGTEPVQTDRWYHLVGVRDAYDRSIRLYVDGERVGERPFCPGFRATGPFVIGSGLRNALLVSNWEGAIDDVRVFDRALDDDAVARLYEREDEPSSGVDG